MRRFLRPVYKQLHYLVPVGILFAALLAWVNEPETLVQFRMAVFDEFLRLKPRQYEPVPVRIINIDDESIERFGQWPWPRTLLGKLLDRLNQLGSAVTSFDIQLIDPDRTTPSRVLQSVEEIAPNDPVVARLAGLPDHDQVLAAAMARSRAVIGFAPRGTAATRMPLAKASFATAGDDPRRWVPSYPGAAPALPALETAALGNGVLGTLLERDGIVRRVPLLSSIDNKLYPAIGLEVLRVAQGARTYVVKSTGASGVDAFGQHTGMTGVRVGNITIPTGHDGTVWIHATAHRPERFVPAWRILDGSVDPDLIKDHVVLIGTTAEGLKELRPTPLDPAASGVEIDAQLIEQMLLGDNVERPDWARGAELVFMLAIALALLLLLPRVGARWTALVGIGGVAPAVFGSWYVYATYNWLLDPVFPSFIGLLVYLSSSAVLFLRTESERRYVRHAFGRYLSPSIVAQLAEHPERLTLGGEARELTIMFSDIRSFTTIAEGLDPHGLTTFLNRYLTPMTDVILSNAGTVDKYMADGIMAFWNAPLDDPTHAKHACRAALDMRSALVRLNDTWRAEAAASIQPFREVRAGIGLNTGQCVVGNLGSDQRFDYSVLGDDANVASRLEGQTKTYHVDIIVGERTADQVPDFALLELDLIQVVGKTKPVRIFFLLGDNTVATTAAFAALATAHEAMIIAYRRRQWDEALEHLDACRSQAPEILQYLYQLYEQRVSQLRASPPPLEWNGVYEALTK